MKHGVAVFLVAISTPAIVAAQDISGGVTLGFGDHSISGIDQDMTTASLDGRVNLAFANGVTMGVEGGYVDIGVDGVSSNISAHFVGVSLGYRMANGFSFGAYAEQLTGQVSGLPIDLSLKSIGAELGYETGNLGLGLQVGRTSVSPDIGVEADTLGLTAKYAAAPNLDIAGAFLRANISVGGSDTDVDLLGVAAAYDINEQFSLFGGVSKTSVGDIDVDFTTVGLGVGYDLSEMAGIASTVSLEVARTDISLGGSSEDLDSVRLGLTFPLGEKGTEAPLNSVADSIFNPRAGAINAALTGAF